MEKYLLETHAHTSEVSCCGKVDAKTLVEMYIDAGYSGTVITDHYSRSTFVQFKNAPHEKMIDYFLTGWRTAKAAANADFTVLLGMELNFYENSNDYLVYGIDESFLFNSPNFLDMGIKNFMELAHKNGLLVYQAHPFRNQMSIVTPHLLDGIEVLNANMRHDSRNEIALAWAEKFGLRKIGGSDFHQPEDLARSGIYTNTRITDNQMLIEALKSGVNIIQ